MQYEQATGALATEALLRRIADGLAKGEVEVGDVKIVPVPQFGMTVSVEDESEENLAAVILRLTPFRHISGPVAVERELSHPGG